MPRRDSLADRLTMTFATELEGSHRTLVSDTLALERDSGDAERQRSVFRIMHTLKGAARAAGVPAIETLCHSMESELARAKAAGTPLTPLQLSLLLAVADAFADASQQLKRGEPVLEESVAALLRRMSGRGSPFRAPPVTQQQTSAYRAPVAHAEVKLQHVPVTENVDGEETTDEPVLPLVIPALVLSGRQSESDDDVRIGISTLEGLFAVTGELLRLAARMEDQPLTLVRATSQVEDPLVRVALVGIARRFDSDVRVLHTLSSRLIESVRHLRQRPFSDIVEALPRAARDISVSVGKPARLVVEGGDVEADRPVLELLREPLLHLVRNAVDHGLEQPADRSAAGKPAEGTIVVKASMRADLLRVTVSDDGAGINLDSLRRRLAESGRPIPTKTRELADSVFEDGFSTRGEITEISGRGVGLGIVRSAVESVGGGVHVSWREGAGTTFTMEVPVTVAVLRVVIADVGGYSVAIPTAYVERISRIGSDEVRVVDGASVLPDMDSPIPLASLASLLGAPFVDDKPSDGKVVAIRLESGSRRMAAVVRDVLDEREVVMRPLDVAGGGRKSFLAGATLLPDGNVALVIDVPALLSRSADGSARGSVGFASAKAVTRRRILVVDDSITTRSLEESVLTASGYDVETAVDGVQALELLQHGEWDIVVSDIEMPRMDGIELCRRIRESPGTQALPLILVTSLDKPEDRLRGLEAGADAYITKSSFDQDTLLDTIRQLIGRGEREKA